MTATSTSTLNLLDDLARIDSVNPGPNPAGPGGGQKAPYIARWGWSAGLRADVLEGTASRPSVVLRAGRAHGGRLQLPCGHLDTVGLAGSPDGSTALHRVTCALANPVLEIRNGMRTARP